MSLSLAERRAVVAKLHAAELDATAIAEALDVSPRTIGRDLAASGLTPRRQGRPRSHGDDVLEELVRAEGQLDTRLQTLSDELSTDEERTARMRRLLDRHQREIEEGRREASASELHAITKLDLLLGSLERFYSLRELTREP